ncbi:MAG: glycosyltransferase [Xanthomonadales bacterium]|nr:glycosyltransferase [Xanthomonadales bacterium]
MAPCAEKPRVVLVVPCYNEGETIAAVIERFGQQLPDMDILVFDNGSTDETAERARAAGATVIDVPRRGKGNVVRRMFADVDADLYLMVDGDDTYDPSTAPALLEAVSGAGRDMAVAIRRPVSDDAHRTGHELGNILLGGLLGFMFGRRVGDVFSGYRAFSRRFVKSFPLQSCGFEVETEMTVHALSLQMDVAEVDSDYRARGRGSQSKLRTWHDGWNVLGTMVKLFTVERPLFFYGVLSLLLFVLGLGLGIPVVLEWLHTGLVPRFPTAILASAVMLLSALSLFAGLILDTVSRGRREARVLAYLRHAPP